MPKTEPIVIIKDTREPVDRCLWRGNGWKDRAMPLRKKLDYGDYSVQFHEAELCIEWKSVEDMVASVVGERRTNFEEMWQRARPAHERWLIICGRDALLRLFEAEYRSGVHAHSVAGTIFSWADKYDFHVVTVDNSVDGEHVIYWVCREFLNRVKEQEKGK